MGLSRVFGAAWLEQCGCYTASGGMSTSRSVLALLCSSSSSRDPLTLQRRWVWVALGGHIISRQQGLFPLTLSSRLRCAGRRQAPLMLTLTGHQSLSQRCLRLEVSEHEIFRSRGRNGDFKEQSRYGEVFGEQKGEQQS